MSSEGSPDGSEASGGTPAPGPENERPTVVTGPPSGAVSRSGGDDDPMARTILAPPPAKTRSGEVASKTDPERERTRALVLALLAGAMESPSIAAAARAANERSLALIVAAGADAGVALIVQLVLDGYFLAESFGTMKLGPARKKALRAALLRLIEGDLEEARHEK